MSEPKFKVGDKCYWPELTGIPATHAEGVIKKVNVTYSYDIEWEHGIDRNVILLDDYTLLTQEEVDAASV